jgi:hypothetical protein
MTKVRSKLDTLEIKHIWSPDLPCHPSAWSPISYEDIFFLLEMNIGFKNSESSDIFYVEIAAPEALRARSKGNVIISQRATLVIADYRWKDIISALEKIVSDCDSDTWDMAVTKLQRYFTWEYEGMK